MGSRAKITGNQSSVIAEQLSAKCRQTAHGSGICAETEDMEAEKSTLISTYEKSR